MAPFYKLGVLGTIRGAEGTAGQGAGLPSGESWFFTKASWRDAGKCRLHQCFVRVEVQSRM